MVVFALGFAATGLMYALQLHRSLSLLGHRVRLPVSASAAITSWSIGLLTPARAGDLSLGVLLRSYVPPAISTAVVVVDKLVSLVVLASGAAVAAVGVRLDEAAFVATGAFLVIVAVALMAGAIRSRRVNAAIGRFLPKRLGNLSRDASEAFREASSNTGYLAWTLSAIVVRWLALFWFNWVLFRAVGATPGLGVVVAATAVGRLMSLLPVSIGGIGIKEPLQILIYDAAGVSADAVVAVSVLGLIASYVVAGLLPLVVDLWAREEATREPT